MNLLMPGGSFFPIFGNSDLFLDSSLAHPSEFFDVDFSGTVDFVAHPFNQDNIIDGQYGMSEGQLCPVAPSPSSQARAAELDAIGLVSLILQYAGVALDPLQMWPRVREQDLCPRAQATSPPFTRNSGRTDLEVVRDVLVRWPQFVLLSL